MLEQNPFISGEKDETASNDNNISACEANIHHVFKSMILFVGNVERIILFHF